MVLPMQNPPAIPPSPVGFTSAGMQSAAQGACTSGRFGSSLQSITTSGMTICSCVALYHAPQMGAPFGALMHYDSNPIKLNGDKQFKTVNEALDQAISVAGLNKQTVQQNCLVFLAFREIGWSSTAAAALNELTSGNYVVTHQYEHNGSAALASNGAFFDHYKAPPGPLNGGANLRRRQCTIL